MYKLSTLLSALLAIHVELLLRIKIVAVTYISLPFAVIKQINYFLSFNTVLLFLTAFFRTHTFSEYDDTKSIFHQFVILENKFGSVVAINREDDTVIAKVPDFVAVLGKKRSSSLISIWMNALSTSLNVEGR